MGNRGIHAGVLFGRREFGGAACAVPPWTLFRSSMAEGLFTVRCAQPLMLQLSRRDLDYVKFLPL